MDMIFRRLRPWRRNVPWATACRCPWAGPWLEQSRQRTAVQLPICNSGWTGRARSRGVAGAVADVGSRAADGTTTKVAANVPSGGVTELSHGSGHGRDPPASHGMKTPPNPAIINHQSSMTPPPGSFLGLPPPPADRVKRKALWYPAASTRSDSCTTARSAGGLTILSPGSPSATATSR